MTTFTLTLDLIDHAHPENQRAQHHAVLQLLDQAKQSIGASIARSGEITNAGLCKPFEQKVIGSWQFTDDEKEVAA